MIGIILIIIISFWWLTSNSLSRHLKLIISCLIFGSYVYYLHWQGASFEQIVDILFPFVRVQ